MRRFKVWEEPFKLLSDSFTIVAFWTANQFTITFDPAREMYGSGNANTGLFFNVF